MLSLFYSERFIYQYPYSIKQLSQDFKAKFSQGFLGKFRVIDLLDTQSRFYVEYSGKSPAKIYGIVYPNKDILTIEIELRGSPLLNIIIIIIPFTLIIIANRQPLFLIVMMLFVFFIIALLIMVTYYTKKRLKRDFETLLNLEGNNTPISERFTWE